jgi:serine/threonine protein kinase
MTFRLHRCRSHRTYLSQRSFGEYKLLDVLGRGSMDVVYRTWQSAHQRSVALKILLAGPFASPDFARPFRREADAAARVRCPCDR